MQPLATGVFCPCWGQIFALCWPWGSSGLCLVPEFAGLSQLTPGRLCCRHSSGTQGTELVSSQLRCPGAAPSSQGCWALGAAEEPSRNESISDRAGSSPGPVGCVVFWQRLLSHPYPFLHRELSPFKCFDLAEMFQFNISFAMPFSENQYAPLEVLDHA